MTFVVSLSFEQRTKVTRPDRSRDGGLAHYIAIAAESHRASSKIQADDLIGMPRVSSKHYRKMFNLRNLQIPSPPLL